MSYTDAQMVIASQIAYMDFNKTALKMKNLTVRELLEIEKEYADEQTLKEIEALIWKIDNNPGCKKCGDWIIKDIRNEQNTSGMYACMIDTGGGEALIAFRGSESDTLENIGKDWIQSDIGLVNNILTPQQATAERYMRDLYARYGSQYESFGVTGHSLGGNLAEHAVITAPDAMRSKISRCVNLDGPGYSQNYMIAHANDIEKSRGILEHYQWSWVGALLTPIPGSGYQTVSAETPTDKAAVMNMLWRHDTKNVRYDTEGNFISGKRDWLAVVLEPLAKTIDYSIFWYTLPVILAPSLGYNSLDQIRDIEENFREWQNSRGFSGNDIEFKIRLPEFYGEIDKMAALVSKLENIGEEISRIEKQLAFDSLAAGCVKVKLWMLANKVESDGVKLNRYCEKGQECGRIYQKTELQISEQYT